MSAKDKFTFSKDGKFLENQVGVSVSGEVDRDTDLALALAGNRQFPPGTTRLAQVALKLEGASGDVSFGDAQGRVSFKGDGAFGAGLGVYETGSELLADLDPGRKILAGVEFNSPGVARLVALNWNYNLGATLKGAVALGAGAGITFGVDGSAGGFFAVVRAFAEDPPSRDAIAATVTSWKLPRQVRSLEDLEPGAWLIAEVNGAVAARVGAQYGFDQTWLRNVNLQGLSGPVGLRVQAAVEASVGLSAAGKYLVVVARESVQPADRTVRVRLFKMAMKGLDFAFNADVGVTPKFDRFLPGQLEEFIAGAFGVQGAQLVEDLRDFRDWTDPSVDVPEKLAGFVSRFAAKQLSGFAGTEIEKFEEARKRIAGFLDQWEKLGHSTSTALWAEIRQGGEAAAKLETVLRALADTTGDDELKGLIADALSEVGFFRSPFGKWLESAVTGSVLGALGGSTQIRAIREAAAGTLALLDGRVLQELIAFADEKLNLKLVEQAAGMAQFDSLEPWLKAKIQDFLGRNVDLSGLEQVRQTLRTLVSKADEIYRQALQALRTTYRASFAATYARSATSTALVDVSFDCEKDPGLGTFLAAAVNGDLHDLLVESRPGIRLREGVLTHGIKRQSHVAVVLPHVEGTLDHVNQSLATMKVVEDGGRLFAFELNAGDEIRARRKFTTSLAITGKVTANAGGRVRTFATDEGAMTFSYRFRQAAGNMRALQLEQQVSALEDTYFPATFGGALAPGKVSIHEWVGDLDNFADEVEKRLSGASNGTGNLGATLLSLEVSLPGRAVAAWFNAPSDAHDPLYMEMSRAVQRALRRVVPMVYFQDPGRFNTVPSAAQLLVYKCLPVSTTVKVRDHDVLIDQDSDVFWDFLDQRDESVNQRFAMIFKPLGNSAQPSTAVRLNAEMMLVRALLKDNPDLRSNADSYAPGELSRLLNLAWERTLLKNSLLFVEAEVIKHARQAGLAMARFRERAGQDPEQAIAALSEFGARLTNAFHNGLGSLFDAKAGAAVREFSSVVFLEAARVFDPALRNAAPSARLDLMLLRRSAPASALDDFLAGGSIAPELIAIEQPVVSLAG